MARPLRVDGVFDIETEKWDQFRLGGLYTVGGGVKIERDEGKFFARLEECQGTIWTWGGGRYDLIWLAYACARRGVKAEVSLAGARITSLKIIGGPEFRDGFALYPVRLAKAAPIAGLSKDETGLDCVCGQKCGGYCAIRKDMPESSWRRLGQYLEADLHCTFGVVEFLVTYARDNGIQLRGTVGASAWATAKEMLGLPDAKWSSHMYEFARQGYYGGRTEVYMTAADFVHLHDLNSAYPWALTVTALPVGSPSVHSNPAQAWAKALPGVYEATITIPEMDFPPLPLRLPGRVVFPHGELMGVWTQPELAYAESRGGRITNVRRALVWPRAERILEPFCQWGWDLRASVGKETALGGWLKFLLNSLTGKTAMAPEFERFVVSPDPDDIKRCPGGQWCAGVLCMARKQCCDHVCRGTCKRWEPIDRSELLWAAPDWKIHTCAHVQWAAYLTAVPRIELNTQQIEAGRDRMVYSDTDSCYATERLARRAGKELGEWNYEGSVADWRAVAPKSYAYWHMDKGKEVVKAKGISSVKTRKQFDAWAAGAEAVDDRGVLSLKQAAARPDKTTGDASWFRAKILKRSNRQRDSTVIGGRIVEGNRTRSCDAREIAVLLDKRKGRK